MSWLTSVAKQAKTTSFNTWVDGVKSRGSPGCEHATFRSESAAPTKYTTGPHNFFIRMSSFCLKQHGSSKCDVHAFICVCVCVRRPLLAKFIHFHMLWTETGPKGTSFRSSIMRNGKAAFFVLSSFLLRPQLFLFLPRVTCAQAPGPWWSTTLK